MLPAARVGGSHTYILYVLVLRHVCEERGRTTDSVKSKSRKQQPVAATAAAAVGRVLYEVASKYTSLRLHTGAHGRLQIEFRIISRCVDLPGSAENGRFSDQFLCSA